LPGGTEKKHENLSQNGWSSKWDSISRFSKQETSALPQLHNLLSCNNISHI
jgi:hypothetical protein